MSRPGTGDRGREDGARHGVRVCFLTDSPGHPVTAATADLLRPAHRVEFLDPDGGADRPPAERAGPSALADVYLLKAHTPRALALARFLEGHGASVVNTAAATGLCQDRSLTAGAAVRAGLPFPRTRTLAALADQDPRAGDLVYPLMVKSRHNRRRDLVTRVDDPERLRELAAARPDEPVVLQDFTANSGWDHKLWVVAGEVFTGVRPGDAGAPSPGRTPAPVLPRPPASWLSLALRVGEVFGLDVYGVDLPDRDGPPVIVDVNAFPGIRGQAGAPRALAALTLRAAAAGPGRRGPGTRPAPAPRTGPAAASARLRTRTHEGPDL